MDKKTPASENSKKVEPTFDNSSFGNDSFASIGSKSEPSFDSSDASFKNEQGSTKINESAQNDEGSFLGRIVDKIASFKASSGNSKASTGGSDSSNSDNQNCDDKQNDKKPGKKSFKRRFLTLVLEAGLGAFVLLAILFVYFDSIVLEKFGVDDKWVLPAVVYSRPLELYADQKLSLQQMKYELRLLKYRQVSNPRSPGEFAVNDKTSRMVVLRRPFDFPDATEPGMSLLIEFNGQRISKIVNADTKEELGYVRMDPVLLDRINRIDPKEDRIFISKQEVPEALITTLLEIEDRSFKTNLGVNFFAIIRAFVKNTIAHSVVEGGSTITQQLVKNYFLNSQKSYSRKIKEIIMALIMNQRYTKDQILEAYLNEIYLGQNGSSGVYGFGLASYFYFGVPVSELTQDQMALLVGIIKGPSYYDPWRHPDQALERRNVVLAVLKNRGIITNTEYEQYTARPLGVIKRGSMNYSKTPAFMGVLKREIASKFDSDFLSGNGIKIFTSLDPQAQLAAEKSVEEELKVIEKERHLQGLEAAMVVSSWRTAEVSAVVGSRTPQYAGFNRVVEGKRQVGSIIKPFVYLTAFNRGIHLGTVVHDEPITVRLADGKKWQPHNDDKKYHGSMATYVAMARSMNIPTVKIGMRVGLNSVRDTLLAVGVDKSRIPFYPSILLGTIELTPFEVNQIYTSLATEGRYKNLTTLRTVIKNGKIVYERKDEQREPTLDPRDSYLTMYVMMQATKIGTGRRIGRLFPNLNIATKTGTTNDSRDTWSVGIDSDQVVATWVGFDDNKSTGLFGSSGAMRVYAKYLQERGGPSSLDLKRPDGVKFVNFNKSGNIVGDNCILPGLNLLPARLDKIRYVDQNCTVTVTDSSYKEPVPYSPDESND
ncbi:MAG: penicillin-binding protein 1B [Aeromonadales bacterium]|nr:penicillin-binding protein 1B [Aeromonadales bacterium]